MFEGNYNDKVMIYLLFILLFKKSTGHELVSIGDIIKNDAEKVLTSPGQHSNGRRYLIGIIIETKERRKKR